MAITPTTNVEIRTSDDNKFLLIKKTTTTHPAKGKGRGKSSISTETLTYDNPEHLKKLIESANEEIKKLKTEIASRPKSPIVKNEPSFREGAKILKMGFQLIKESDLKNLDIDSIIFIIQAQRAKNLEAKIVNIAAEIKNKNDQTAIYNAATTEISTFQQLFPKDADDKKTIDKSKLKGDELKAYEAYETKYNANKELYDSIFNGSGDPTKITKGSIEVARANIKGTIDSLSTSSQLGMVDLQTYMGRRNEAFEIISTIVKKMQDSRSGILQRT